jgi:hypothetical protein
MKKLISTCCMIAATSATHLWAPAASTFVLTSVDIGATANKEKTDSTKAPAKGPANMVEASFGSIKFSTFRVCRAQFTDDATPRATTTVDDKQVVTNPLQLAW